MTPPPADAPEPGQRWYEGRGWHAITPWRQASVPAREFAAKMEREGEPHDRPGMPVETLLLTDRFKDEFGAVRLEHRPEGLVLWVGGEVRWRSWRDPDFWHVRKPR